EFAVRDGVPYAIDFLNVAPDMDYHSVGPVYFEWVVENMARLVIERALSDYVPGKEYRWDVLLNSAPPPLAVGPNAGPSRGASGFQNTWQPFQVATRPAAGNGQAAPADHEAEVGGDQVPEVDTITESNA